MSVKSRLQRLTRKMNNENYSQMANELILNLYFPAFDEDTGEDIPMSMAEAINWIAKRKEIAAYEQRTDTTIFQDTVLEINNWSNGGFLESLAPEYPQWPEHLKPYQQYVDCIIAAHLMNKHEIYPNEI